MSSKEDKEHTSIQKKKMKKMTNIPPVQRKIILHLANSKPKTINETANELKAHYKSTWNAFKKLEEKNFVKSVGSKLHQGQVYPQYWVTGDGAFIALCEGAKQQHLIRSIFEIYPDNKDLQYLLESVSILGTEAFKVGYLAIVKKGKLEQEDITRMLIVQSAFTPEILLRFREMLLKYPEQKKKYDDLVNEMIEKLRNLDKLFNKKL